MKKLKNSNGPFTICYHFQCGERQWIKDASGKCIKFASEVEVNKYLKKVKNAMAMIDVYDKDNSMVYSEYFN